MIWFLALLGIWIVIYPATDYYLRWVCPGVVRRGPRGQKLVHLSFDDGPDPRYTPRVLQVLADYRLPASFFVVGCKVEHQPGLTRRIVAEGHEVGSHTYEHRHAYGLGWAKSNTAIVTNAKVLCKVLGRPITWFRPPWGAMNLFEWIAVKKTALRPLLWTSNAKDWLVKSSPRMIQERLLKRVKPGAILLLHDSGGQPGAPEQMLQALPGIIEKLRAAGYQFVSLQEIAGGRGK